MHNAIECGYGITWHRRTMHDTTEYFGAETRAACRAPTINDGSAVVPAAVSNDAVGNVVARAIYNRSAVVPAAVYDDAAGNVSLRRDVAQSEQTAPDACLFCRADDELRFCSATDDDFIREYRRRLTLLSVRVSSDYPVMQRRLESQMRRLDALEGIVPKIHMQEHNLREVSRDVRALKRMLVDLQCAFERQQRSPWHRVKDWWRKRF